MLVVPTRTGTSVVTPGATALMISSKVVGPTYPPTIWPVTGSMRSATSDPLALDHLGAGFRDRQGVPRGVAGQDGRPARRHGPGYRQQEEVAAALAGFAGYRRQMDERRAALAAAAARPMISDLVGLAATLSDANLEDQVCLRLGRILAELDDAGPDDHVGPDTFAGAVIDVAAEAVSGALMEPDSGWLPSCCLGATPALCRAPPAWSCTPSPADMSSPRPGVKRRSQVSRGAPPAAPSGSNRPSRARASGPAAAPPAGRTRRQVRPEGQSVGRRARPRRG